MITLLKKEISEFLSSLIGYIVIGVFLTAIGLFMWVFPGANNIIESGYATLDTLFVVAPWVYMFLIPAITMKSFSEEKRTGTLELLLTKPLKDWQIILSKYLAGLLLVGVALIPTLVYYFTVYNLALPVGNIDVGAIWGSYIGLFFLAGGFVSIGLFSSAISDNQIVAFIIAVFLSFFFYTGFDQISSFALFGTLDSYIIRLGINSHYLSLSRGVIDSRDVLYFFSLVAFFLLLTHLKLASRKW